jgi:Zn-dependent protease
LRVRLYPSRYVEDTIGAHSVTAVLWAQVMQTVAATPERRLGATIAAYVVYLVTGARIWLAIAELSAFLNLFNLIPIWQLDGARGLHVLSREQRVLVLVVIAVALWATGVRLLWIVGAVAMFQTIRQAAGQGHRPTLVTFGALVLALAWFARIHGQT